MLERETIEVAESPKVYLLSEEADSSGYQPTRKLLKECVLEGLRFELGRRQAYYGVRLNYR